MVWAVATWNEMEQDSIHNAWRALYIMPWDWNTNIVNLQERGKLQIDREVLELEKLIASLNLGNT